MTKSKIIPLDVMFANDKGDVFEFTNVILKDPYDGNCCYSNSRVDWILSKIFNKTKHVQMLKKVSHLDPKHKDNFCRVDDCVHNLDQDIASLEKELAKKKLLRDNIIDGSKHIRHVNLRDEVKDLLTFN